MRQRVLQSPVLDRDEESPPTFSDLLRYLWDRRVRLLVWFVLFSGVGGIVLAAWWMFAARSAHAVVSLDFRGIERHEYPSGRKFVVEDLRSPKLLAKALADTGLERGSYRLQDVYRGIDVVPIVPVTVLERWKKQDRDGVQRTEFLPNEFALDVAPPGLDDEQRIRLLYAMVAAYQAEAKYEQEAERHRISRFDHADAGELVSRHDHWDIPILLRSHADGFATHVAALVRESQDFRDPGLNLGFLAVKRELEVWRMTGLEALAAMVHRDRLTQDREATLQRLQERQANLDIDLQKVTAEADATARLLQVVEQTRPVLAGQAAARDGAPLLDVATLEKVLKSDYVGPVVRRAGELNTEAARIAAARSQVEREIALLKDATDAGRAAPPGDFERLVVKVVQDLDRIVERYLKVLDAYLDAALTSSITLREGPYLRLPGPRVALIAVVDVFAAAMLSLMIVIGADSLRREPRARTGDSAPAA